MPFYSDKRSAGLCVVLGPKKSSTYCREYASGFLGPAALHLPTACSPRNEGLLGQAPSRLLKHAASGVLASLRGSTYRNVRLASSLAAALLDGFFEQPAVYGEATYG